MLVEVTRDSTPGTALDLGTGEGRNALFLAENGWTVTGLDISPVAIQQARKNATDRKLNIEAIVADLDAFDFGQQRWNLITSFFMHAWHGRSKTDVPVRIYDALKPGGVVVIEAFANPPSPI
ncbi:MAG: class I SAM-dependent methyltransferase [Bryobacteraceae bacterium]|nr:class I SAM-dependent methyltransferase [Bryobacteraceae bacterium]